MHIERKKCPYCGEDIAVSAKKCRFCGEWFSEILPVNPQFSNQENQNIEGVQSDLALLDQENYPPAVQENTMPEVPYNGQMVPPPEAFPQQQVNPTVFNTPNSTNPQQINNNPQIIFQPNIVVENTSVQTMEGPTESVEKDESSTNWLYVECLLVGVGVWISSGSFWWGLITTFLLFGACAIPYIGHVICVVLGATMGIVAGVTCSVFGAGSTLAWIIGIGVGIGCIGINLEGRK